MMRNQKRGLDQSNPITEGIVSSCSCVGSPRRQCRRQGFQAAIQYPKRLCALVQDGLDFRYLIYGRALAAYYGRDLSGKTTRDLSAAVGNLVRREYLQAYADQRPVLVERRRRVRGASIMIAKLILPLSSDGRAIDLLLAGSYPHP